MTLRLITPDLAALPAYRDALERGWSPDNVGLDESRRRELAAIEADPAAFVASLDDPQARGDPISMPDGTLMERLPGYRRWLMDGEAFCGAFGFRWRPGTETLPPHVLGHMGYAVPEWRRGKGYATRGLALLLPGAWAVGLAHVDLTTEPDNIASQKVIQANGGYLVERFTKPEAYGQGEALLWRIEIG